MNRRPGFCKADHNATPTSPHVKGDVEETHKQIPLQKPCREDREETTQPQRPLLHDLWAMRKEETSESELSEPDEII